MSRIENTTLNLYLTSGLSIKVFEDNDVFVDGNKVNLNELLTHIRVSYELGKVVQFNVIIPNLVEDGKDENGLTIKDVQMVTHEYNIPHDRLSWFMIERVNHA